MEMLIVTFRLNGLDDATYRASVEVMAPIFLDVPGPLGKTWLADPATKTYGGVYAFVDRQSLDAYLASDIVRSMLANPHLNNMQTRAYCTLEGATRITHGLLPVAAELSSPLLSESVSSGRHW